MLGVPGLRTVGRKVSYLLYLAALCGCAGLMVLGARGRDVTVYVLGMFGMVLVISSGAAQLMLK